MEHIDYGLGVFSARAFDGLRVGEVYDLAELYGEMLERGERSGMEIHQRFYEIGSQAGLEETENFLAAERAHKV